MTKHESFIILKVFKVKVVFIFHFDHFLDLGFGTIVDGATGGCSMDKKKILGKTSLVHGVKTPSKSQEVFVDRNFPFKWRVCKTLGWQIWKSTKKLRICIEKEEKTMYSNFYGLQFHRPLKYKELDHCGLNEVNFIQTTK